MASWCAYSDFVLPRKFAINLCAIPRITPKNAECKQDVVLNNPVDITREMWVVACGMVERISYAVDLHVHDGTNVNDTALCSNFHLRHYSLCILQIDGSILRWLACRGYSW